LDAFLFLEFLEMKLLESDAARWLLRTLVFLAACWCGGNITGALLELILNSFGFLTFAVLSTAASYFLFWFAWFGFPSLVVADDEARSFTPFRPSGTGVLLILFAVTAATISSGCSAIYLMGEVARTFPDRPGLCLLIAVPFFVFILYMGGRLDESIRRGI
jgi:hypothetical protein